MREQADLVRWRDILVVDADAVGRKPVSSVSTSSADSTSLAPDLMSAWQPLKRRVDRAWNGEDLATLLRGGARGDEEPDASAASTTRQPRANR